MGHDITAYRPDVNQDEVRDRLRIDDYDAEWSARYRQYCAEVQIAYNRRSAGNPLNQVLYLALGVMDEAYAGCSGNGAELDISLDQFEAAQKVLEVKRFDKMTRDRNMSDDLIDMFAAGGATIVEGEWDADVSQEKEFVAKCLAYMKAHNLNKLRVDFG